MDYFRFRGTQGKIYLFQNPTESGIPEGRTHTNLCHNTILLFYNLPHRSMLPGVPGLPSPLSTHTAAVRCPRHPQPVDAETERQGRIRFIEFGMLMYTHVFVINRQCLREFDMVALKNGPHIRKC